MASYGPPHGGNDPNNHLQAMFARIQAARNTQDDDSVSTQDPLSRFSTYHQGNAHPPFYDLSTTDSPVLGNSDSFPLPAAPSPPSNFTHSQHPPGMMNLGPIGSMPPSNATTKPDQSANLLNLLKFSGGGQQKSQYDDDSQPSPTTGPAQPASFDGPINLPHNNSQPPLHAPVPMPADPQGLLATLMKGTLGGDGPAPDPSIHKHNSWSSTAPSADTQAYLLNLLHRPKPSQNDQSSTNESSQAATLTPPSLNNSTADHSREYSQLKQALSANASHDSTPMPFKFGTKDQTQSPTSKFEYTSPAFSQYDGSRRPTKFDYTNPFDEFAAPPPQNGTPKSVTAGTTAPVDFTSTTVATDAPPHTASNFQVLKKAPSAASSPGIAHDYKRPGSHRSSVASPQHLRRRFGDTPTSQTEADLRPSPSAAKITSSESTGEETKETVADAINGLAEKADKEAQEALENATNEVESQIADELEDLVSAKTDAEFQEAAQVVAKDIMHELDRKENEGILEETYSPETAQAIRDIVEDAAHGPVADSWESAEADEIVVIEEEPIPIKVYNFPMKPWISITMQDTEEPRPHFRDEVVLDIARLKKEFDQIDRNLVSATESYMTYGMSKAGGLRVIRQDDGRDAKLFTDTKDRIFNVAISSTPSDLNTTHKESIIGTGISGTVYYVQIKNGDKDHIDDPNPEQYGFALPPISAQEGDTPGGVLKTRARISSSHPDYFAVGRGKTISIIWPAYIMQNNLFKPGHDRVVDTEKLAKQCALRINTGKAGKDFTFSQDDTTIVSLDKSGRVKFWDVRELTAADEDSDPRFPMPAQTSLEVKEPLLTLNTTPEGEKAWPTSVLLLDKQRPYQKRCALRYMIVGMKQNHTLQLWDLALGKPVQEFNLPHSKESDAVCSVMYHSASGMIIVGHPTRNSIYFLHLSAPKYTIKGLSQVEYIQKLVAKDASIPEPDSTAVISGVREYSFSNKGVLRSLDILGTPVPVADSDEPSLFELYAMHSKGVTAIWVKNNELGWTKDNKVIAGVDAVEAGLVKIAKLKELPSAIVPEAADEIATLPIKIAARTSAKETPPPPAASHPTHEQTKKGPENNAPTSLHPDRKETEVPVTPINQLDKTERKARKKKERSAAAAAAAAEKLNVENTQSNGSSHSPRVGPVSGKGTESRATPSAHNAMSAESVLSAVKQIEASLGASLSGIVANEMKDHKSKIEAQFRSREDSFNNSQKDLLNLVATVLNENVQAVLARIVSDQFEDNVIPSLSSTISQAITEQIEGKISGRISHSVQNQMQKLLPNAVTQALQKPELSKAISDKVVNSVAIDMEESFRQTLMTTITPIFSDMAVAASRSVVQDVQQRTAEQIEVLEQRHITDNHKIDQLTAMVTRLSDTVSAMAATQSQFQDGFLKMQQQLLSDRVPVSQPQPPHSQPHSQPHSHSHSYGSPTGNTHNQLVPFTNNSSASKESELQHVIANIASQMERGDYETGLIRWLQAERKHEVFDKYIVKFNPNLLQDLPMLVSLSVGTIISEELDGPLLRERVTWLEVILHSLHSTLPDIDPQIRDVLPNIMSQFINRLETLFMRISSRAPGDPILKHISGMTLMANRVREVANATRHPRY